MEKQTFLWEIVLVFFFLTMRENARDLSSLHDLYTLLSGKIFRVAKKPFSNTSFKNVY